MNHSFWVAFFQLFIALDVIGTLPLFITITQRIKKEEQTRIINTSMIVALAVAMLFLFLGSEIFRIFQIALFDFKIAGGLILLLIALTDLIGGPETISQASGSTGIVPLAVPLITGPGVITTLVLQVNTLGFYIPLAALFLNYALAWLVFSYSKFVNRGIGRDGTQIISKLAILLLATLAISMIRTGIFEAIQMTPATLTAPMTPTQAH